MARIVLFLALAAVAAATLEYADEFDSFVSRFSKVYANEAEKQARFTKFAANHKKIDNYNRFESSRTGMTLAINEFADMSQEEFFSFYVMQRKINATELEHNNNVVGVTGVELPTSIDWVTKGAVTHIKNQGQCGSCWSFSTTGSVEGAHFLGSGTLKSFSEANLVDCSSSYGNNGCNGGLMDDAFKYIIANPGIDTESQYPYVPQDGPCKYQAPPSGCISAYHDVTSGSESALKEAAAGRPVSVAIDASHFSFQFYHSGVYYEPQCSSTQLDHGVLVAGYGESNGSKYWLVKNSWGTSWGQSGYIWMSRDRDNNCGIATMASYPTYKAC